MATILLRSRKSLSSKMGTFFANSFAVAFLSFDEPYSCNQQKTQNSPLHREGHLEVELLVDRECGSEQIVKENEGARAAAQTAAEPQETVDLHESGVGVLDQMLGCRMSSCQLIR